MGQFQPSLNLTQKGQACRQPLPREETNGERQQVWPTIDSTVLYTPHMLFRRETNARLRPVDAASPCGVSCTSSAGSLPDQSLISRRLVCGGSDSCLSCAWRIPHRLLPLEIGKPFVSFKYTQRLAVSLMADTKRHVREQEYHEPPVSSPQAKHRLLVGVNCLPGKSMLCHIPSRLGVDSSASVWA